jgi:hypothetical protein
MGSITGQTGTPFTYSPSAHAPDPTGTVFGGADYDDTPFAITLVNPVTPTWSLTINVSGITLSVTDPSTLESVLINLNQLSYTAEPNWGGATHSGNLSLGANPATTTISWPAPSGAGTVTVTITGSASTSGDLLAGGIIPAQAVSIQFQPEPAAFTQTHETIAWLLGSPDVDPNSGALSPIVANFAGVQP